MLPDFVEHHERRVVERIFPEGVYQLTEEDVEAKLVRPFEKSLRRREVFRRWTAFRAQVRSLVSVQQEFIDGSFVTERLNPDDMDVSFWIRAQDLDSLRQGSQLALEQLIAQSKLWNCDAYVVPVCEAGHPAYPAYVQQSTWTTEYWSNYSNPMKVVVPGVKKGYIEVVEP